MIDTILIYTVIAIGIVFALWIVLSMVVDTFAANTPAPVQPSATKRKLTSMELTIRQALRDKPR